MIILITLSIGALSYFNISPDDLYSQLLEEENIKKEQINTLKKFEQCMKISESISNIKTLELLDLQNQKIEPSIFTPIKEFVWNHKWELLIGSCILLIIIFAYNNNPSEDVDVQKKVYSRILDHNWNVQYSSMYGYSHNQNAFYKFALPVELFNRISIPNVDDFNYFFRLDDNRPQFLKLMSKDMVEDLSSTELQRWVKTWYSYAELHPKKLVI
jgi:hypothetical protein